jgi:hypothetical protein
MSGDMVQPTRPEQPAPMFPEQPVRYMPPDAMGPGSQHQAVQLLQLGAAAGARGMTEAAVSKFHGRVQDIAVGVTLTASKELMELVDQIVQARLNEVAAAINALGRYTMPLEPVRGLRGLIMGHQPPAPMPGQLMPEYLALESVQRVIVSAIAAARVNS